MMKSTRALVWCLGLVTAIPHIAWSGCVSPAGASGSNPNSRYVISLYNQEVYDTQTDITWQRCPFNWFPSPDGKSCFKMQGVPDVWSQRLDFSRKDVIQDEGNYQYWKNSGFSPYVVAGLAATHYRGPAEWLARGWQIPSKADLSGLIDHICKNPAINQEVFPNTHPGNFWTSSGKGTNSHDHYFLYVVNFAGDGSTDDHEDYNAWPIRLMHKGKTPAIQATLEKRPVATQ